MSHLVKSGSGSVRDMGSVSIENLVIKAQGMGLSLARASISGSHGPTMNSRSSRTYYLLDGECTFTVGDQTFIASAGDVVLVPVKTPHGLNGEANYLVLNSPAFDPSDEVTLE